jgi:hypothetical protein
MKIRNLPNKTAGAILGFTLLLGIGVGSSATSYAQYPNGNGDQNRRDRNWDGYGNYGGSSELRQTALNAGYNEGIRARNYDRQYGRQSNYRDSDAYQNATRDYNSRLGDRELYRRYFREAFENGYNANGYGQGSSIGDDRYRNPDRNDNGNRTRRGRNWDGYGNLGGSFQLRQTALNAGYNEGIKQGRNDRNRRNNYGFQGQSAYQKATKDYSSRLGDRSLYQQYFRAAYQNGYSDGVNGY